MRKTVDTAIPKKAFIYSLVLRCFNMHDRVEQRQQNLGIPHGLIKIIYSYGGAGGKKQKVIMETTGQSNSL